MTEFEAAEAAFARCHAITGHGPAVPNRIAELEAEVAVAHADTAHARYEFGCLWKVCSDFESQLAAMAAQRDHALLRMEVAIATSNSLIDAEVQRRIAEAKAIAPPPRAFPSRALRHQSQPIGLLSTADSGRVRLGGYAPSLPPR